MLSLRHYDAVKAGTLKEPPWMKRFHVHWPESSVRCWHIERFNVELNIEALLCYREGRGMFPGNYTRLVHDIRGVVMSDTTAEIWDMKPFYAYAKGRILIHGLGLGCMVKALLSKQSVTHIDVVEVNKDIIDLVGKHFKDPRVTIYWGDAFTYKWPTQTKWDCVWHDIWDTINSDYKPQITTLKRKFGGRCRLQMSWLDELIG